MPYFSTIKAFKGHITFIFFGSFLEFPHKMSLYCIWLIVGSLAWFVLSILCLLYSFEGYFSLWWLLFLYPHFIRHEDPM
jgi:hypothetical protein